MRIWVAVGQYCLRTVSRLTVCVLLLLLAGQSSLLLASDRDTPVYRIYVDPVTGKYSTKPPDSTNSPTAVQPSSSTTISQTNTVLPATMDNASETTEYMPNKAATAIGLLIAIATLSLVTRRHIHS